MRVLVSAYACEPDRGSEPGAGWHWVRAIAAEHDDVVVLTRANNAPAIEEARHHLPEMDGVRFEYLDLPSPWTKLKNKVPGGVQVYYAAWQRAARRRALALHDELPFDLVHHLTFAVDWMPAGVFAVPAPRVWGPVGGTGRVPMRLWRWLGVSGVVDEVVRTLVTSPTRRLCAQRTARRAGVILAQNKDVAARYCGPKTFVAPNVVVAPADDSGGPDRADEGDLRTALFVGRQVPLKGMRLALAVLAHPLGANWRLEALGGGREVNRMRRLAERLGVADRVEFRGQVSHAEVVQALRQADAMLATSMREAAGFAVAEAIANGCPVVAFDRGGHKVLVDHESGELVPTGPNLEERFASALSDVGKRRESSTKWGAGRLPAVLNYAYSAAVESVAARGESSLAHR